MVNKTTIALSTTLSFMLLLQMGCSTTKPATQQTGTDNAKPKISTEPVTLTATIDGTNLDDDFIDQLKELLKVKHPNITLDYIKPGKGTTLNELIAAGQTPDIIISYNGKLASYKDLDLQEDMTPLIKKHNLDIGRFEPYIIEDVKIASTNDEIFGIPINMNFHALFYNKDVFDKFGVPYPKDGMNWDQIYELAKRLTRSENGVQYRGFDGGSLIWMSQPLGIAAIDYKTDKATINTDQWKKVFELGKKFYTIPGNQPVGSTKDIFLKEKTIAMHANLSIFNELEAAEKNGLNWDVVQYPSYPEKPNIFGNASVITMSISKTSKYKDQAMQVIQVAVSDEQQLDSSKKGRVTPLKDPKFKAAFGTGRDSLKNKNLQGIFKSRPVKYPIASKYRGQAESIVTNKFYEYLADKTDVNTALARAEEEINKMVEQQKIK